MRCLYPVAVGIVLPRYLRPCAKLGSAKGGVVARVGERPATSRLAVLLGGCFGWQRVQPFGEVVVSDDCLAVCVPCGKVAVGDVLLQGADAVAGLLGRFLEGVGELAHAASFRSAMGSTSSASAIRSRSSRVNPPLSSLRFRVV